MQLATGPRLGTSRAPRNIAAHTLIWLTALLAMLVLVLEGNSFPGTISSNEDVYLIRAKQLLDSSFLANDWLFGSESLGRSAAKIPYDLGLAALWQLSDSGPIVAIIGRVCAWLTLALAFLSLVRALGLSPFVGFIAWAIWFKSGQSLGAGEWIWGSVESKCFAYAAVFLGLKFVFEQRLLAAGITVGIGCWLHVLVGGWSAAFICIALLFAPGWRSFSQLLRFALPCGLLGAGSIAYFFISSDMAGSKAGQSSFDLSYINVVFRNPHHLFPPAFGSASLYVTLLALPIATWFFSKRVWIDQTAALFSGFVCAAAGVYIFGIICGYSGATAPLLYYPFRVGDALIPLLSALAIVGFIGTFCSDWLSDHGVRRRQALLATALIIIFGTVFGRYGPEAAGRIQQWQGFIAATDQQRVQQAYPDHFLWVRENTAITDIVFTAPCVAKVFIGMRRANVVSFKSSPVSAKAEPWYQRLVAANGGPIKETGGAACKEMAKNFAALNASQLREVRDRYHADWYVVENERPDLGIAGSFADDAWIYPLAEL